MNPDRPVAPVGASTSHKARQAEILGIAQSFVPSAVLFALLRLGVFGVLGDRELTSGEIAAACNAKPSRLERVLDAAVMLGLLRSSEKGGYAMTAATRGILTDGHDPAYLGDWLTFMSGWYEAFGALDRIAAADVSPNMYKSDVATIRTNTLAMHNFAASRGRELVEFLDLSGSRSLLDVGCGPGTYSFEIGKKYPEVALTLVDSEVVLEVARQVKSRYDLSNRVSFVPLDLSVEKIGGEYDTVLVSNVLQAFDLRRIREILRDLFEVILPGGSIVVQAQFLDSGRQSPRWPVYVDLALLSFSEGGRNHSVDDTMEWLRAAGFTDLMHQPMSLMNTNGFVRGFKKKSGVER